ncbi:MAG: tRNA (adenosine(37)-N6)-threonylcarbamoyltransferase complex ATPase subunit type 1 TsaE [Chloroflexi bacterium]|nr:tRNA (adenosine(37)-N6)-threonylcarbamoyltransferase complex ATPase subunit type 1 TsaE [Chloroflexota bacterium]
MSHPSAAELALTSNCVAETQAIGAALGELLVAGDVICLRGDLGSGKTCLTQGIGRGLRINETINSPTFVLIREHQPSSGMLYLYHADLYRIDNPLEVVGLGLNEYFYGDGVTVIEWAERAGKYLPYECLWIELTKTGDAARSLAFRAVGERYEQVLGQLQAGLQHCAAPSVAGEA